MKKVFESVISGGSYALDDILNKINKHHILGNLTDSERDRLETLAREGASPSGGVNVMNVLTDHDKRIRELEALIKGDSGASGGDAEEEFIPEFDANTWYYKGDKITFNGQVYVCTAPEGIVCVWTPATYPAYWSLV